MTHFRSLKVAAVIAASGVGLAAVATPTYAGSTAPEYVQAKGTGVSLVMLAAAGDRIGNFTLPGVPDGLGVYKNKDGSLTVLVNHELSLAGPAKDHKRAWGGSGSFVSKLTVDVADGTVTKGEELIKKINWWNYATDSYGASATSPAGAKVLDSYGTPNHTVGINRFCSADLVPAGALLTTVKEKVGKKIVTKTYGYDGAVYLTGEEGGDESRAFAVNMAGEAFQLPRLGLAAWENLVTAPNSGRATVVMGNEDGSATDSQLWMYVGKKTDAGTWADKAGFTNGKNYVMQILDDTGNALANDVAFRTQFGKGKVAKATFATVGWDQSGNAQNAAAARVGTVLARVEDGAWDPRNPNVYWFVTTESAGAVTTPDPATNFKRDGGALWKLTFVDAKTPLAGATIEMVLDGKESIYLNKPDNMSISPDGTIMIQEDPGGNDHIARIVSYNTTTKKISTVAQFNPSLFGNGAPGKLTNDEESSGIVDITSLVAEPGDKASYFLFDAQVHAKPSVARPDLVVGMSPEQITAFDNLVVEGGALYLMKIDDIKAL
ncbi:MAG: hypothetical protein RL134_1973 [Actinomycetota bacterium]